MIEDQNLDRPNPPLFATTHWTMVVEAGQSDSPDARQALEALCETYWYPLYAFARGLGRQPEDAQDLVQGFFAQLIEKNSLRTADQTRGRFRTFLLTSFKRFTNNDWVKSKAVKRGGGTQPVSLDFAQGEERWEAEAPHAAKPDREYERRWAIALIDRARERLRDEFVRNGKVARFEALEPHLSGDPDASTYTALSQKFGITEGGVKAEAFRLRQRYRSHLRAEVARTVLQQEEIDDEISHLMTVLSG